MIQRLKKNHKLEGKDKYYTYSTKENPEKKIPYTTMYGLNTIDERPYVFVVEGIFDAVKLIRLGQPTIAVVGNDPKPIKNFLFLLQKYTIVICDNDIAGKKLSKFGDLSLTVPKPYKDLGDMPLKEVANFISKIKGIERISL